MIPSQCTMAKLSRPVASASSVAPNSRLFFVQVPTSCWLNSTQMYSVVTMGLMPNGKRRRWKLRKLQMVRLLVLYNYLLSWALFNIKIINDIITIIKNDKSDRWKPITLLTLLSDPGYLEPSTTFSDTTGPSMVYIPRVSLFLRSSFTWCLQSVAGS